MMAEPPRIPEKLRRLRLVHEAEVFVREVEGKPVKFDLPEAQRLAFAKWLWHERRGYGAVRKGAP
jgi:hypothetical protein